MQMSYGEIVRSYKEAKEPKKQIGVLADLNAVGRDEIAKILYDAGEINKMTYGQYQRHGKKAVKTEPTETAEVCEQVAPDGEPCRMPEKAENVHVPEAVIEMVKDTLAELKSAYGNAKKSSCSTRSWRHSSRRRRQRAKQNNFTGRFAPYRRDGFDRSSILRTPNRTFEKQSGGCRFESLHVMLSL